MFFSQIHSLKNVKNVSQLLKTLKTNKLTPDKLFLKRQRTSEMRKKRQKFNIIVAFPLRFNILLSAILLRLFCYINNNANEVKEKDKRFLSVCIAIVLKS